MASVTDANKTIRTPSYGKASFFWLSALVLKTVSEDCASSISSHTSSNPTIPKASELREEANK
jgi:hypothetical protein